MLKSDFSNYTGLYGRGNYLIRELLALVEHCEKHPQTAAQLKALFDADATRVDTAMADALERTKLSGPAPEGDDWEYAPPATALNLTPATVSIAVAAASQLTATPTPADAAGTTTYVSSAPAIATVSASGLVTGVAAGSATITATRGTATDTTAVTVTA